MGGVRGEELGVFSPVQLVRSDLNVVEVPAFEGVEGGVTGIEAEAELEAAAVGEADFLAEPLAGDAVELAQGAPFAAVEPVFDPFLVPIGGGVFGFMPSGEAKNGVGAEVEFGRDELAGRALARGVIGSRDFVAEPEGFRGGEGSTGGFVPEAGGLPIGDVPAEQGELGIEDIAGAVGAGAGGGGGVAVAMAGDAGHREAGAGMEAFAERVEADAGSLPTEDLFEGVEGFRSSRLAHEISEKGDAEGAGVLAGEVGSDDVVAAGAAFEDSSVGSDQEVIADVGPAVGVDVEGPDGADPGGIIADGSVGGMVDYQVGDGGVGGVVAALFIAIGATPLQAGDDAGAIVVGFSAIDFGNGDAGVDQGELEGEGVAREGFEFDPALSGAEPEE